MLKYISSNGKIKCLQNIHTHPLKLDRNLALWKLNPCKRKVRPVSFRTECLCTKRDCVKTVSTTKNHYHITTILHTTSFELTFLVLKNDQVKDKIALQC